MNTTADVSPTAACATLNELFFDAIEKRREMPAAVRYKAQGKWVGINHATLLERVHNLNVGLRELGITATDRIAILSENRPEWAITDFACLTLRAANVPIYPTLPANQIAYVIRNSGARAIFCSTAEQVGKVLEIRNDLPALELVIAFDSDSRAGVLDLDEVERSGAAARDRWPAWREEALTAKSDDLATLIYTAGTTGDPKGVMLSHGNIASNVVGALQVLDLDGGECLSFLPLSHIFERMVGHYTMLRGGVVINYATDHTTVITDMPEVRPTIMASVPRLYEKIHAAVVEMAHSGGSLKRAIFEWAVATGLRRLEYRLDDATPPWALKLGYRIADLLVFRKLRQRTGGRLDYFVSGGAPLNPDISRFFLAAGLPILEGYGLTETSPVITVNPVNRIKPGTVGLPIPGVEVSIADDGEILTRGPHVMLGYYNNPEATARAIDPEGWFHTGDIGEIDADGYLRITDRKKDIIVTAGGKNIAPQPIEALLKTNRFVANGVMLGDRRRFPIMLLVPDFEVVRGWARSQGISAATDAELTRMPRVRDQIEREARKSFRDLAHYEMPKKFLVLDRDFTIESGELTPKLSVRRRVVEEHWKDQIEALYAEPREQAES